MTLARRSVFTLAAALSTFAAVLPVNAQDTTSATGILHFTFRDSARGTVVRPDAILIDGEVKFHNIDEAGRVSIPVSHGNHQVKVMARGYDDLDSRQTAATDHAPMNLIMLDPAKEPDQLKPENLGSGMPADGTFIAGFITDDVFGKPMANATVELVEKNVQVKTDEDGFFKLPVSMPDGKIMPEDPRGALYAMRDFRITKPGYGFEERLNVLVETGSPKVYQLTLIRGGGGNSVDEAAGRNNLQSSLFGLANVEPEDAPTTPTAPEDRVTTHSEVHDSAYEQVTTHTHTHEPGKDHSH